MRKGILERAQSHVASCPSCGYEFAATMTSDGTEIQPEVNSLVICVRCAEVGQYTGPFTIIPFDMKQLMPKERRELQDLQRTVKSRWVEPN